MDKIYALNHSPIDFHFSHNTRDFIVREIPLYDFSNQGEHQVLNIRKKALSTLEMIKILSNIFGCKASDIGYAGLKDKSATTSQYISIHRSFTQNLEAKLPLLEEKNIKILSSTYHNNKLKIGHLKGNNFFIRLKKITPAIFTKIDSVLQKISTNGLPNYFGYQRFGKDGNNHIEGKKIAHKELRLKNKTINNFLLSSYQSFLFNQWLESRVKLSRIFTSFTPSEIKHIFLEQSISIPSRDIQIIQSQPHFFKLLEGDIMHHYPHGKIFTLQDYEDSKRFLNKDIVPTGLLPGIKTARSSGFSRDFEQTFDDDFISVNGTRRFAWIWVENLKYRYVEENAWVELEFSLPKGSYATTLIEELSHRNIRID